MFGIGIEELIVILVIVLLLFGGTKLPELSKGIAASIRDIRKGFSDELKSDDNTTKLKSADEKVESKK